MNMEQRQSAIELLDRAAPLPWAVSQDISAGSVFAADQSQVAVADVDGDMPDVDADHLAAIIAVAVNEWAERNRLIVAEHYEKGGFVVPAATTDVDQFRAKAVTLRACAAGSELPGEAGIPDSVADFMIADYLRPEGPTAADCAKRAKRYAEEAGVKLPSVGQLARHLIERCPPDRPDVILAREGREALIASYDQRGSAFPSQECPSPAFAMPSQTQSQTR